MPASTKGQSTLLTHQASCQLVEIRVVPLATLAARVVAKTSAFWTSLKRFLVEAQPLVVAKQAHLLQLEPLRLSV